MAAGPQAVGNKRGVFFGLGLYMLLILICLSSDMEHYFFVVNLTAITVRYG